MTRYRKIVLGLLIVPPLLGAAIVSAGVKLPTPAERAERQAAAARPWADPFTAIRREREAAEQRDRCLAPDLAQAAVRSVGMRCDRVDVCGQSFHGDIFVRCDLRYRYTIRGADGRVLVD